MTVENNNDGRIIARMCPRDLVIIASMFAGVMGFMWTIKLDLAVVRSEVKGHEKEINNHENRIDRLERERLETKR